MEEFKDAEEELPSEEETPQITSVPFSNSHASTLSGELPVSSDVSIQKSTISSEDLKEIETIIENATTSPSEPHDIPSPHPLIEYNEANSSLIENSLLMLSENTTENSMAISPEIHGNSDPRLPVENISLINPDETNVISEDSASLSSEIHEAIEVQSNALNEVKETKDAVQHQVEVNKTQNETKEPTKQVNVNRGLVDTTAPFESVKEAVSRFGGIVDWKAHRAQALERRKRVQLELKKVQEEIPNFKKESEAAEDAKVHVLNELDATKRLVEELKLNLEKAQTEEAQAKQDSELAQLRAKEMEQGITNESSVAAKAQLELAKARHDSAVTELKAVKVELENLQKDYAILLNERDSTIQKAEESILASKEIEKTVEDLTLELIAVKESLESAHAAHLEAEEHRIGSALARDQDYLYWEKELNQAEEELQKFQDLLLSTKDIKERLDASSKLLLDLNAELSTYMESKLVQESVGNNKELEELKTTIEKVQTEVTILRTAESSLKSELEKEKAGLANMRQREGMASIAVTSVEAEIERTKEEIKSALANEKEYRAKMVELPKLLQQAAQENELAKTEAQLAKDELRKAKEECEQAKATKSTIEIRLNAALKEIEASKASESLALLAIKALKESEGEEVSGGITLPLDEYYNLSKKAQEAEELSNELITSAIAQIEVAKESELKTLEKLEEAYREMNEKKEALRDAMEKFDKAQEGKLGAEQELRNRRASNAAHRGDGNIPPKSPARSFESEAKSFANENIVNPGPNTKVYMMDNKGCNVNEVKARKKKKKSFFPRIVMFLARKKQENL